MRDLLLLLLLLGICCMPVRAQTASTNTSTSTALPACDKAVRFHAAWFPDPEIDNRRSAAELTKMDSGSRGTALQLGHVVVQTKLSVTPQTRCQGVVVQLDYIQPVLRVASEFTPGSCAHARVMNHEWSHVRIHRDIARQFRELNHPWGAGSSSAAVLVFAKQELDRLMRAQELFDSPEEYARSHTACGGEIARLMKPAAVPGPAGR